MYIGWIRFVTILINDVLNFLKNHYFCIYFHEFQNMASVSKQNCTLLLNNNYTSLWMTDRKAGSATLFISPSELNWLLSCENPSIMSSQWQQSFSSKQPEQVSDSTSSSSSSPSAPGDEAPGDEAPVSYKLPLKFSCTVLNNI